MDTRNRPDLHELLRPELHYLNRAGFTKKIAPLMRQRNSQAQVLVWTSLETLHAFRSALKIETEIVRIAPDDWRERAEFLAAIAAQGALEVVFDEKYAFRTGQVMIIVEAQKTLTACLT